MNKSGLTFFLFLFVIAFTFAFGQTDEDLGLHSEGGPWDFYPSKTYHPQLPNVLLIGNSVMNGYKNTVINGLKEKANVDYWLTPKHLKSNYLFEDFEEMIKRLTLALPSELDIKIDYRYINSIQSAKG